MACRKIEEIYFCMSGNKLFSLLFIGNHRKTYVSDKLDTLIANPPENNRSAANNTSNPYDSTTLEIYVISVTTTFIIIRTASTRMCVLSL